MQRLLLSTASREATAHHGVGLKSRRGPQRAMMRGALAALLVALMLTPTLVVHGVAAQPSEQDAPKETAPRHVDRNRGSFNATRCSTTFEHRYLPWRPVVDGNCSRGSPQRRTLVVQFNHVDGALQEAAIEAQGWCTVCIASAPTCCSSVVKGARGGRPAPGRSAGACMARSSLALEGRASGCPSYPGRSGCRCLGRTGLRCRSGRATVSWCGRFLHV